MPLMPDRWETRTCWKCGKEFQRRKSRPATKSGHYFCSQECTKGTPARVEVECHNCGSKFFKDQHRIQMRVFCSTKCFGEHRQGRPMGNGNWARLGRKEYMRRYLKKYVVEYRKKNPEKITAKTAQRRSGIERATPSWANRGHIEFIYRMAKVVQQSTGYKVHVDHIVPIAHPKVCGLHCEANLQLMWAEDNRKKWNKFKHGTVEVSPDVLKHAFTKREVEAAYPITIEVV